MLSSVLVPIDFFPSSHRVVERAARLPLFEKARVTLLHVLPKSLPRQARRRAEEDAYEALKIASKRFSRSVVLKTVVRTGSPAVEIAEHAQAMSAELIVMGRVGARGWRDLFIGSTAERIIRTGQLPVLVVRLPATGPYRRPVLALDLDTAAHEVLDSVLRIIPAPRPPLTLVHAYDAPFQGFIYPSLEGAEAEEYQRHYRQEAIRRLEKLLKAARRADNASALDELQWKRDIQYGSPRRVIPKVIAKRRADLLVLGTHGRSGIAQAFLGTVAGDVLRAVPCDVLVVPPRWNTGAV